MRLEIDASIITIDPETQAIYVQLSDADVAETVQMDDLDPTRHIRGIVNIDLDADRNVRGVEIIP